MAHRVSVFKVNTTEIGFLIDYILNQLSGMAKVYEEEKKNILTSHTHISLYK